MIDLMLTLENIDYEGIVRYHYPALARWLRRTSGAHPVIWLLQELGETAPAIACGVCAGLSPAQRNELAAQTLNGCADRLLDSLHPLLDEKLGEKLIRVCSLSAACDAQRLSLLAEGISIDYKLLLSLLLARDSAASDASPLRFPGLRELLHALRLAPQSMMEKAVVKLLSVTEKARLIETLSRLMQNNGICSTLCDIQLSVRDDSAAPPYCPASGLHYTDSQKKLLICALASYLNTHLKGTEGF